MPDEDFLGEMVRKRGARRRLKTYPLKHGNAGCRARAHRKKAPALPEFTEGRLAGGSYLVDGVLHRVLTGADVRELVRRKAKCAEGRQDAPQARVPAEEAAPHRGGLLPGAGQALPAVAGGGEAPGEAALGD